MEAVEETECLPSSFHGRHRSTSTISGPLPTDSMVTVRLSDPPISLAQEDAPPADDHVNSLVQNMPEKEEETASRPAECITDANENAIVLEDEIENTAKESIASTTSIDNDEPSIPTSETLRSRSDTSGSFSSTNSAQVDWEQLEKNEEQAPRDEGSDEVGARMVGESI